MKPEDLTNIVLLTQLATQYAVKLQSIGALFGVALSEQRDVTDGEVAASSVARDAQIMKTQQTIDAG